MDNFLSGGAAELKQAKTAITRANKLNEAMLESEKLAKANDKDVESQKKYMNDKIESTIKSRRDELERTHDNQIAEVKKDLKNVEKDRKTAKAKAINDRITGETDSYATENKKLKGQIKTLFKQAKIPTFFNNRLYYALFYPKTILDFLILAAVVILTIAVIPNIVIALIDTTTFLKILLYVGIVLVFLAIYFIILITTRGPAKEVALEKARAIRKRIRSNKKQIRITSDNIRTDTDESSYGLEEFDENIQQINAAIEEKEEAKAAALREFDETTAARIRMEIENENLPVIQQLEADGKALKADFAQKQIDAQNAQTEINNTYAAYLGAKNASPEKIDDMITLIEEGRAQTIMQAIDIINGEIK